MCTDECRVEARADLGSVNRNWIRTKLLHYSSEFVLYANDGSHQHVLKGKTNFVILVCSGDTESTVSGLSGGRLGTKKGVFHGPHESVK